MCCHGTHFRWSPWKSSWISAYVTAQLTEDIDDRIRDWKNKFERKLKTETRREKKVYLQGGIFLPQWETYLARTVKWSRPATLRGGGGGEGIIWSRFVSSESMRDRTTMFAAVRSHPFAHDAPEWLGEFIRSVRTAKKLLAKCPA